MKKFMSIFLVLFSVNVFADPGGTRKCVNDNAVFWIDQKSHGDSFDYFHSDRIKLVVDDNVVDRGAFEELWGTETMPEWDNIRKAASSVCMKSAYLLGQQGPNTKFIGCYQKFHRGFLDFVYIVENESLGEILYFSGENCKKSVWIF
jgi:hypothetical protein